jgi:hypothetical protein
MAKKVRPLFLRVPEDLRIELFRMASERSRSVNNLLNIMLREKVKEEGQKQAA